MLNSDDKYFERIYCYQFKSNYVKTKGIHVFRIFFQNVKTLMYILKMQKQSSKMALVFR